MGNFQAVHTPFPQPHLRVKNLENNLVRHRWERCDVVSLNVWVMLVEDNGSIRAHL
jgi:hypothetical protein